MEGEQMDKRYFRMVKEFLKDLIQIPTVNPPGNEKAAAVYVLRRLKDFGIEGKLQEIDDNRANAVISIGAGEDSIILNGHLDVVPAGDGWGTEPFSSVEKEGRVYGRGSCDMKAGIAAMMVSAIMMKDILPADIRLELVFVADEEIDGTGTRFYTEHVWPHKRNAVIIGEPTGNEINIAHRGVVRMRLKAKGISCHSGRPQDGVNAIQELAKVITGLGKVHMDMQKVQHPFLPPPTLTVTRIGGGIKDNVIPSGCECILDCRTIPGYTSQTLVQMVRECINNMPGLNPKISFDVKPFIEVLPGMANPEGEEITAAARAYEVVMGKKAVLREFPACCDMSQFQSCGYHAFLCGPGRLEQAHGADEYVDIEQVWKSVQLYNNFIFEFSNMKK